MNIIENLSTAFSFFHKSSNIVITTHANPDADAIGSALALYIYGKANNKNITVINHSPTPFNLQFLPNANEILTFDDSLISTIKNADAIFILDLNDSSRLKSMQNAVLKSNAIKIMIDHHLNPTLFCDIYCTDTMASSTGELIWRFLACDDNDNIDNSIATNLYAAIMTDTGSFRFPKTTPELHIIIAKLIVEGANPYDIYDKIYNCNTINATRLLGKALSNIEVVCNDKVCIMAIPRSFILDTNSIDTDIDNFVDKTLSIEGTVFGIMMAEITDKDEVRVSIRSKGDYSAREIAIKFGGGGHFNAAGTRIFNKNLSSAKELVINEIKLLYPELR